MRAYQCETYWHRESERLPQISCKIFIKKDVYGAGKQNINSLEHPMEHESRFGRSSVDFTNINFGRKVLRQIYVFYINR
jgi:hypothetical protein